MQLADGLWMVDGLSASGVYIVSAAVGAVIIDSGLRGSAPQILAELQRAGFAAADVRALVATHAHIDHIGSLEALQQATGAPICAPRGEAAAIEGQTPLPHPPGVHGWLFASINSWFRPRPVAVQQQLSAGPTLPALPDWRVVPTPGHTPEHISLYYPARQLLIAGDALANFGRIRLAPWPFTSDLRLASASAAELAGLPLRSIVFGHGAPIIADASVSGQLADLARRSRS